MGQIIIREPNKFGELNIDSIELFELRFGVSLPEDYKQFLLSTNGGRPVDNIHPKVQTDVHWFLGLNKEPLWSSLYFNIEIYASRLPPGTIPIAGDSGGNLFVMRLDGEADGTIGFWSHEQESSVIEPLATNFTQFLMQLEASSP